MSCDLCFVLSLFVFLVLFLFLSFLMLLLSFSCTHCATIAWCTGTYTSGGEIVSVQFVHPQFTVIPSKQRPRKLTIQASSGKDYTFLLKGEIVSPALFLWKIQSLLALLRVHSCMSQFPLLAISSKQGTRICAWTSVSCSCLVW